MMKTLLYMTVAVLGITHLSTSSSINTTESKFVLSLLNPDIYDRRERPLKNENKPVVVEVGVYFTNIADISEISMDLSISIFLRQMWIDPRLNFENNPDFTGIITLHESLRDMLWLPDLYFRNEIINGKLHELSVPNVMITLSPSGYVFYSQRISTKLLCIMSLHNFPMDTQNCSLEIEPYGHSAQDISIKWKENSVSTSKGIQLPEFNLTGTSLGDCTTYYIVGNGSGSWSCIFVNLHFDRLFEYYIIQVYVPSTMIVILSWVSFWIDIHAVPARISLGLLTVLTITTQSSGVSSKLPKVSYIKGIDIWMFICTVFVFAALIEYSAVNVLARRQKSREERAESEQKANGTVKETDSQNSDCKSNGIWPADYQKPATSNDYLASDSKREKDGLLCALLCFCCKRYKNNQALRVDVLSRLIFPGCFILFNAFYWVYYFRKIIFPHM